MIKKLKRRYLITNMALLSSTLIVCLAVLFGFLYHSQIASSYAVMQEMMNQSEIPGGGKPAPQMHEAEPQLYSGEADVMPLGGIIAYPAGDMQVAEDNGGQQQWGGFDPSQMPNPWQNPWMNPWLNPWMNPGLNPWNNPNPWENQTPSEPENSAPADTPKDDHNTPAPDNRDDGRDNRGDGGRPSANDGQRPAETAPSQQREPRQTVTGAARPDDGGRNRHEHSETTPAVTTVPAETAPVSPHDEGAAVTKAPRMTETPVTQTTAAPAAAGQINTDKRSEPPQIVPVQEGEYVPDAFMAQIDSDGNIEAYAGNERSPAEDGGFKTLHHALDEVHRRGREAGTMKIGDNSYRFLYQPDQTGNYRLVLLDRTLELSTISRLLFIFVLITVVGLLMMFGISVMLANWTVTPVAAAWEKQKQFVADASHELKTPLAVISANTEVILANPAESVAGQSKWLSYIQSETMRMSKLITNLLSVARMDSKDEHREQTAPLPLSEAVSNVCLVFEPIIYENGKTLNTVIQRNVMIRAEEDNIKQMLSILLDNAVLHSLPKAQITVSLSKDTQNKIRLSVSNTAKDIPPEQLSHLFDRFYRIDTEGSPNGSGLGLSIAKSIVHELGGTLSVTSENQLVTFTALLHP